MAKIPLLALGLSFSLVSCSSSKVPEASSAASSGSDAKLKEDDAESKKGTKTSTSTKTSKSTDDSSDDSDKDPLDKTDTGTGGLDLTRVIKDADECKSSNKYYDLTNTKCTGTLLSSFSCTNSALLGSSSKIKTAIGDDKFVTFKDHFNKDYPGYEFKFCYPDTRDGAKVYRLVAWKKTSDEIKSQPFFIPNND